jgi:hypothetical protein
VELDFLNPGIHFHAFVLSSPWERSKYSRSRQISCRLELVSFLLFLSESVFGILKDKGCNLKRYDITPKIALLGQGHRGSYPSPAESKPDKEPSGAGREKEI